MTYLNQRIAGALASVALAGLLASNANAQPAAKPNIIVILSDDMGYSDISPYGGEIRTPTLQKLADNGKIFSQFYNTARCCPSRASLLTGLYSHQAGVGHLIFDTGHIGYGDHLTSDSVTVAEVLKEAGYSTYMAGKWHLAPRSYDPKKDVEHWPTRRGFDKFYGTIAGSGSFWDPSTLCRGETYISPENDPEYKPEKFYYTDALSDNAIKFVSDHEKQSDDKPFFLYLAYTAAHWPLHAPEEAIKEYKGKYDQGYEPVHAARIERLKELNLIPNVSNYAPPVGDWDNVKNKAAEARLMETYAAMVTIMDEGIGRLMETLREEGELENTLIVYLQDNGGCAEDSFGKPRDIKGPAKPMAPDEIQEKAQPTHTRDGEIVRMGYDVMAGPPDTFVAYKENWANVSNAPLRLYKHYSHEGGISTPLIAHWPQAIKTTSGTHIVREPAHLIDLMATFIDVAGAQYPAERKGVKVQPLEGKSLVPVLTGDGDLNRSKPLFFEHESNRAVRDGKWKLVAVAKDGPWELYDMDVDRAETNNLAEKHPEVVKKMAAQWDEWAKRARVLPLGGWEDRRGKKRNDDPPAAGASEVTLKQGEELPVEKSLNLTGKGISIVAEVESGPVEGVIVAQGASIDGFSLFAMDGKIHFVTRHGRKKGDLEIGPIPEGQFTVGARLRPDGHAELWVKAGPERDLTKAPKIVTGKFPGALRQTPAQGIAAGVDIETPVGDYPRGFPFKGKLATVTVETLEK